MANTVPDPLPEKTVNESNPTMPAHTSTMTPGNVQNGTLSVQVGFAPQKPAEFVILEIADLDPRHPSS